MNDSTTSPFQHLRGHFSSRSFTSFHQQTLVPDFDRPLASSTETHTHARTHAHTPTHTHTYTHTHTHTHARTHTL